MSTTTRSIIILCDFWMVDKAWYRISSHSYAGYSLVHENACGWRNRLEISGRYKRLIVVIDANYHCNRHIMRWSDCKIIHNVQYSPQTTGSRWLSLEQSNLFLSVILAPTAKRMIFSCCDVNCTCFQFAQEEPSGRAAWLHYIRYAGGVRRQTQKIFPYTCVIRYIYLNASPSAGGKQLEYVVR